MADIVYSREQINDWQSGLKDLAKMPRTQFTKQQAVGVMVSEIEEALKNHSYAEVSETLKGSGLDISEGQLKQYVNAYKQGHTSPKPKRKQSATAKKNAAVPSTANSQETKNQTASKATDKQKVANRRSPATKKATPKAK